MTAVNTQEKNLRGKTPIKKEHIDNNAAIRSTLGARGIKPELMPPEEDIKKLERRINKETKKKLPSAKPILLDKPWDEAA